MDKSGQYTVTGSVEEIIFRNPVNGYTVASVAAADELVTVVGTMPDVEVGETVEATGTFSTHPTFGEQLSVSSYLLKLPENSEQLYKFLSSGVIPGIGPKKAVQIIEKFGENTLKILEENPERLSLIKGISDSQAKKIGESFKMQYSLRTVMLELGGFGITPSESIRIFRKLGGDAAAKIRENPYCLCELDIGIGFERAQLIEKGLDKAPDPSFRLGEGIIHVLSHNMWSLGHTCIPRSKVLRPAGDLLDITDDAVDAEIDRLISQGRIRAEKIDGKDFVFLPSSYMCEKTIARRLGAILRNPPLGDRVLAKEIDKIEVQNGIHYEELQRTAILTAANKGLLVLTGGPGTGKTTALNGIITIFEKKRLSVSLAAPTGRAAQRMSEVTGREAKTIHRLLEVEWDESDRPTFRRCRDNPLECDAVILDELSMVDTQLFAAFLDALPLGCRLIMVGDCDQLPPVGPGNVLKDIIASGVLPVVELDKVFRQALESSIIRNAHRIVTGESPETDNNPDGDFFHMEKPLPAAAARTIASVCAERLPKAYGYSPYTDIQVLCPSKKGDCGTVSLNRLLQQELNPASSDKKETYINGSLFREGDKVMQIKNNYSICWESAKEKGEGIFNGDIGVLKKIDAHAGQFTVDYDGKSAVYAPENVTELELAYAVTVHKSQGSEFRAVVLACAGVPPKLAYKNLLYTAVTRARELCITVGTRETLSYMAGNSRQNRRYSALCSFLNEEKEA